MAKTTEKILIVDDDRFIRMALGEAVRSWGYETIEAGTVSAARTLFTEHEPSVALLDIDLPDGSGLDLLNEVKEKSPETIAVMITGNIDVANSLAALRGGAHDFIGKPVKLEELRVTLRNALETRELRRDLKTAQKELASGFSFDEIIGESKAMKDALDLARRVAESDIGSVLLYGE